MGGCVVQVWFDSPYEGLTRPLPFSVIETEARDFAEFCEWVAADQVIGGAILWTTRSPFDRGLMEVNERQPVVFRGAAVMRCVLPRWRFADASSLDDKPGRGGRAELGG